LGRTSVDAIDRAHGASRTSSRHRTQAAQKRLDRVGEPAVAADVHERRVPADTGRDDRCAGARDPPRLTQRFQPILPLWKVVKRAEQQDGVLTVVGL
jgi:hypothetical protein